MKKPQSFFKSNWLPKKLKPVPPFYPLERSSRFVKDDLATVVNRVSEVNRLLSVHAVYCNKTASASLLTSENVEMHLSLWKTEREQHTDGEGIVVEIQRRKGDSIAFHRYSRCILDAAAGVLDLNGEDIDVLYSNNNNKKNDKLLNFNTSITPEEAGAEIDDAIRAVEIAHGLLMKDRMDARRLGLESLCLLTDPKKTGPTTALLSSHVVLLGTANELSPAISNEETPPIMLEDETPFQEIRQTILSLIQFNRIGDDDEFDAREEEEEEHITILHNLALAVLANALDVIENEENLSTPNSLSDTVQEEDVPNRRRLDSAESISEQFLEDCTKAEDENNSQKLSGFEIIKTLISELDKARTKPHNACLSAKCIGSLCRSTDKATSRAKELGAKTVVQTALDVGTFTHLKLERECDRVLATLTAPAPRQP